MASHILVAEDQADIRELIVLNLQQAGYATDPMYADKLARIIGGTTLRQALSALASTAKASPEIPSLALVAAASSAPSGSPCCAWWCARACA